MRKIKRIKKLLEQKKKVPWNKGISKKKNRKKKFPPQRKKF